MEMFYIIPPPHFSLSCLSSLPLLYVYADDVSKHFSLPPLVLSGEKHFALSPLQRRGTQFESIKDSASVWVGPPHKY